jgi:hypothetical protein
MSASQIVSGTIFLKLQVIVGIPGAKKWVDEMMSTKAMIF